MLSFKNISLFTAIIAFTLSAILLFFPSLIYWLFQIPWSESADFISRRAAFLFLGLGTFVFMSKDAMAMEQQKPVIFAVGISMAALSFLGLYEFVRGFAGPGILLAIITEILIAISYFQCLKKNKD